MKTFRIVAATFVVLLGSVLMVTWSLASATVRGVNDGTAAVTITQRLMASPAIADAAAQEIQTAIDKQVGGGTVGSVIPLLDKPIHDVVAAVLRSNAASTVMTGSVKQVSADVVSALTERNRPEGPVTVTVDLSDGVNARLDQIPVVGALIPPVTVPSLEVTLIDANRVDAVRHAYAATAMAATWFGWLGLILIVAGALVVPLHRGYWTQAALGAAVVSLGVAFAVNALSPSSLASVMPGGASGGAGTFVSTFVSEGEIARLSGGLFVLGTVALVLAALFAVAARQVPAGWSGGLRARARAVFPSTRAAVTGPDATAGAAVIEPEDDSQVVDLPPLTEQDANAADADDADTDAAKTDDADTDDAEAGRAPSDVSSADAPGPDVRDAGVREASVPHFLPEPVEVVEVEAWPEPRATQTVAAEPWALVSSREPVARPERRREPDPDDGSASGDVWVIDDVENTEESPNAGADVALPADEEPTPVAKKPAARKPAAKKGATGNRAAKKAPAPRTQRPKTPPAPRGK